MSNQTVIFLHSPRSGGTTLRSILRYQYGGKSLHSFRNGFTCDGINSYFELPYYSQKQIKCFRGHILFGLHEYIPNNCTYITLIRNPIMRVISLFGYTSGIRGNNLYKPKAHSKLKKFLDEGHAGYCTNDQLRRIVGKTREQSIYIDDLEIARQNINNYFSVVGITEHFDESILLMRKKLNWRNPYYIKNNVHGSGNMMSHIPNNLINQIKAQNQLDLEFYNEYVERFKQIKQDNVSQQELNRFQFINKNIVNQVAPPIVSIIRKLRS